MVTIRDVPEGNVARPESDVTNAAGSLAAAPVVGTLPSAGRIKQIGTTRTGTADFGNVESAIYCQLV